MHFSASDGSGDRVSIWDSYNVDDDVKVWGKSSAGFGEGLKIDDIRGLAGPGSIYAVQGYAGSGGYVGMSYIYAEDASQTLARGSAHLTPGALGVVQDVSIKDAEMSAVVSTADRCGRGAMQHAFVGDGSLKSTQTISVNGGIATSQDTQMVGYLPTAFGTAGYMDVNMGPGTLNLQGEGAAVAVSSLDVAGPATVDCKLATGTGNSAWAYGDIRYAESDLGAVGAAAGAGKIDLEADWTGGVPGLFIDGYGEAAAAGIGAIGVDNEIKGTLEARTGDAGTSASGRGIEASNREGILAAAAAAGNLGVGVDLQNGIIEGGAEAAGVGVLAEGRKNEITSGTLAAGTGFYGTGAYGGGIEASNRVGSVVAAAAAGGLGGIVDLQNGFIGGGAEAAGVGVMAEGRRNRIASDVLAAGTGWDGTGAYGRGIEAQNREGVVGAAAAAGGLGALVDLQNGFIDAGAEAAGVGVMAEGRRNWIASDVLAAGTGWDGTGAYGGGIEAQNREGAVGAGAAAGGLGASFDLQNGFIAGWAEAAGVGVLAEGYRNRISSGTLAAGTGWYGTGAIGQDIVASNKEGGVAAAAAAGGLGAGLDLQNGVIAGWAEAAGVGVQAEGRRNEISSGTLAAGTGWYGTGAIGQDIEASNKEGGVAAAAAAGGLGASFDLQNGVIAGSAEAAGVGVLAEGRMNEISSGTLAAGTGWDGTGAIGQDIEASNKEGGVAAAAAAGGLGAIVDLQNGFIAGGAEAAGVGAGAVGKENEISSGILAAGTGFFGTGTLGGEIEASNKEGYVVAAAAAGGVEGAFDFNSGNGIVEAEGAIFGAGAAGAENEIGVGLVAARVGNSAEVVAIDVDTRSTAGAAGTGVAAGNAELQLLGGTPISLVAEGSAVGAGGYGATAAASADLLMAESGDSTSASGENLWLTVIEGDGIIGAISGTYDSSGPDRVASVSGDVAAGSAMIWGDFSADTSSSASASAENVGAVGTNIFLDSYADDGTAYSEVYTLLGAGGLNFGEMEAYAGDSTRAKQKYTVVGDFQIVAEASNPPDFDIDPKGGFGAYDVTGEAWTDNTGAHAEVV